MVIEYHPGKQLFPKTPLEKAIHFVDIDIEDTRVKELLLPHTEPELIQYVLATKRLRARESTRLLIMRTQNFYGFPLRPNMTVNEARAQIWIHKKGTNNDDLLYNN